MDASVITSQLTAAHVTIARLPIAVLFALVALSLLSGCASSRSADPIPRADASQVEVAAATDIAEETDVDAAATNTESAPAVPLDEAPIDDLISLADHLIAAEEYTDAQIVMEVMARRGHEPSYIQLAEYSIFGIMDTYSYSEAIDTLSFYADKDDPNAIVLLSAISRMTPNAIPHAEHRISYTRSYLLAVQLERSHPEHPAVPMLLAGIRDMPFEAVTEDRNLFIFEMVVDPMTDAPKCAVETLPVNGLSFRFDNQGAYIQTPYDLSRAYDTMGLRIDSGPFYSGYPSEYLAKEESLREHIRKMVRAGQLSLEAAQGYIDDLNSKPIILTKHVSIANTGEARLNEILIAASLGNAAKVRVESANGETVYGDYQLTFTANGETFNLFDLFLYRYVRCLNEGR